ncbi:Hint domain-containing protein [Palleronia caenipelagi]|uniref:Hint domain-containing protein n=1 Tax=Palleronia caenipelagi TaxID=2489174 RepID=A0A547QA62_9RHOB|nr:Hint domain-containing protein [Palleronia caenipelagi]TRD23283.1 Hint domain-containing protein [Palleronia caenipelagi]
MAIANLTDAVLLDATLTDITSGPNTFTAGTGGTIVQALDDTQVFSTASASDDFIQVGDTTVIDGTTWTVTGIGTIEGEVDYTNPDTGLPDTEIYTAGPILWIEVTDGTTTQLIMSFPDFDGLPKITEIRTDPGFFNTGFEDESAAGRGILIYNDASGITSVVCFAKGTLITTENGDIPVENLRPGDVVMTKNSGTQEILWIGKKHLDSAALQNNPKLQPCRIAPNTLGPSTPDRDLYLSPQHRVLISSQAAKDAFGSNEVLIPVIKLTMMDGISQCALDSVDYYHILLKDHDVVFANGAPAETLLPGPEAMKSIGPDARRELKQLFPELFATAQRPQAIFPIVERKKQVSLLV